MGNTDERLLWVSLFRAIAGVASRSSADVSA